MPAHIPDYIASLKRYQPGKPIDETKRELGLKTVIKLASNENPLGPSPKAVLAMRKALKDLHLYPDSTAFRLKRALAKKLKVTPEHLIIGNGSNEVIEMVIRTLCVPGDTLVTGEMAFSIYGLCAQIHGVETKTARLQSDHRFDLEHMLELVRQNERAKVVFIPNPNNPTGTYNTKAELDQFLAGVASLRDGSVTVVLDYAYWEYVTAKDLPDAMKYLPQYPNLVVMRTFSKVFGLAGLRIGYGVAEPGLIASLHQVKQPFNAGTLGLIAAEAALADAAFVRRSKQLNRTAMKEWEKSLKQLGLKYLPSQGNFLLIDVGLSNGVGTRTARDVFEGCLRKGVVIRPIGKFGSIVDGVRISMGTPSENRKAIKVFEKVLKWKRS